MKLGSIQICLKKTGRKLFSRLKSLGNRVVYCKPTGQRGYGVGGVGNEPKMSPVGHGLMGKKPDLDHGEGVGQRRHGTGSNGTRRVKEIGPEEQRILIASGQPQVKSNIGEQKTFCRANCGLPALV